MTFKMVWSTDWHVADNAPENRIDDYTEACFDKIEQIRLICTKIDADACIIGGDVFHIKISAKVRHALVARLISVFQSFPCPVYSIVGNHDISHNNMVTLPEKPLGVLFESGALLRLDDETFQVGGTTVRVVGQHFNSKIELDAFDSLEKGDADWLLCAYHGYASPEGVSYPGETTFRYADLAKLEVDDWFFGHWHIDQGVQEVDGKHFVNVGSLTRGSLNLENVTRTPKAVVCVYQQGKRRIQQIKLKVAPSEHVFDIAKKERTDREQVRINSFIENLRAETTAKTTDDDTDIAGRINEFKLAADVRKCVVDLVTEAELELSAARGS